MQVDATSTWKSNTNNTIQLCFLYEFFFISHVVCKANACEQLRHASNQCSYHLVTNSCHTLRRLQTQFCKNTLFKGYLSRRNFATLRKNICMSFSSSEHWGLSRFFFNLGINFTVSAPKLQFSTHRQIKLMLPNWASVLSFSASAFTNLCINRRNSCTSSPKNMNEGRFRLLRLMPARLWMKCNLANLVSLSRSSTYTFEHTAVFNRLWLVTLQESRLGSRWYDNTHNPLTANVLLIQRLNNSFSSYMAFWIA